MRMVSMPAMIRTAELNDFEAHHRPRSLLDRPVILLGDVVQILGLPKLDGRAAVGDQAVYGRRVGAALVDRDVLAPIAD